MTLVKMKIGFEVYEAIKDRKQKDLLMLLESRNSGNIPLFCHYYF